MTPLNGDHKSTELTKGDTFEALLNIVILAKTGNQVPKKSIVLKRVLVTLYDPVCIAERKIALLFKKRMLYSFL